MSFPYGKHDSRGSGPSIVLVIFCFACAPKLAAVSTNSPLPHLLYWFNRSVKLIRW
ncbi:hypothetical protein BS47DRAFT_941357 [Hydnum rufescens UP504]|uniref:Uncharacterized protein n=1 Tax=Hydnum rufescens UP504 TaxID=1448309 RepID=A0A9P6AB71_9AGAM|nr:hypothetical protein BS47DRAFT_941357 [Hydnum rufescens UP504]